MNIRTNFSILIFLIAIQYGYSQQVALTKIDQKNLKHFSIANELPFTNNCENISVTKERISCLEKELRNQILDIIGRETDYEGEMHLYFTVDKKGNPVDIGTKGFPADEKLEKSIQNAVLQLDLKKGKYRGRKANIRCYTRIFPIEIK
jgi:hypothetical protein